MATAVGVVFSPGGKVYSFDPNGLEPERPEAGAGVLQQRDAGREARKDLVVACSDGPDEPALDC